MAYTKQTWTNDVTAITAERMTHIENGIYDNSLATDKINPSGTATTTAEIEEGQINDVIGFKSLKLKGQTSQETTTGKNKYDLINATNQSGTIERTSDKTGFILRKGTNRVNNWTCSFPAGTYTIQFDLKLDNSTMSTQNLGFTPKDASQGNITSGNLFTGNGTKRYTFTATEDVAYLYFFINNNESSDCVATISNVMVMDGTISTNQDYEPYTGGKASPNPDFPQEVENVSGYNVVTINGSKNLFDKDINIVTPGYLNASGAVVTSDATLSYQNRFIKVQPSTVYTISSDTNTIYRIAEYTADKTFITRVLNANASRSYSFATSSQTHYIKMAGTLTTVLNTLQIEKGNTATSYVAHQGNNFEINLGKNLIEDTFKGYNINSHGQFETGGTSADFDVQIARVMQGVTYTITPSTNVIAYFNGKPTTSSTSYNGSREVITNTNTLTPTKSGYIAIRTAKTDTAQLEKGAIATPYAPYFPPILLGSLGTKTNDIRRKDGKWYWHKEMRKATYNGSEDWRSNMTWDGNVGNETMHFYINATSDWLVGQTEYKSEKFIGTTQNNRNLNLEEMTCHTTASSLYVFLKATRIGATSANTEAERITLFKAWLANNNFSVYYQLLTPIDEEITYAPLLRQLDELYNSGLYDNTNISQDNSSEAFILDMEACKNNINGIVEYIRR